MQDEVIAHAKAKQSFFGSAFKQTREVSYRDGMPALELLHKLILHNRERIKDGWELKSIMRVLSRSLSPKHEGHFRHKAFAILLVLLNMLLDRAVRDERIMMESAAKKYVWLDSFERMIFRSLNIRLST